MLFNGTTHTGFGSTGSGSDPERAGYAHAQYAASLAEFGQPCELRHCQGWILKRPVPKFPDHDGMGCYPIFTCHDWTQLDSDFRNLNDELVSLVLVADPFGNYSLPQLQQAFPDLLLPFKEHFVVDLHYPSDKIVSKHHRYYAKKALDKVLVQVLPDPAGFLDEWVNLYTTLIDRHALRGIKAFSKNAFARQLAVPGIVVFRAIYEGKTVGAHLWYTQGEVGYSHLEATDPTGYEVMAAYALYWTALEYFAPRLRWLELGAGAGTNNDATDGLSRFKRGWATGTRPAYLCGKIFNQARYLEITQVKRMPMTGYFPAYRSGEFV